MNQDDIRIGPTTTLVDALDQSRWAIYDDEYLADCEAVNSKDEEKMPNHVTSRVTVTGTENDINLMIDRFFCPIKDESGIKLDFNKVIQMPEILKDIKASSDVDMWIAALGQGDLQYWCTMPWAAKSGIFDRPSLLAHCKKKWPDAEQMAVKSIQAIKETGCKNWYDWCPDNWGTKWNCYDFSMDRVDDGKLIMKFDTAWSVPHPILEKLSSEFPTTHFDILSFDEGWNFAYRARFYLTERTEHVVKDEDSMRAAYAELYGQQSLDEYVDMADDG